MNEVEPSGARPQPNAELSVEIEEITGEGPPPGPHLPVAAGPILEALANAGAAMQVGSLVRITGSPAVLEGLADGSLHLVRSGDGFLSAAAGRDGRIAGQLRLLPAASSGRLAAGFHVASAITMQYHLHEISSSLHHIEGQLEVVIEGLFDKLAGRLRAAEGTIEDVACHPGLLSALDEARLHGALKDSENVAEQATLWLERSLDSIPALSRFAEESIGIIPRRAAGDGWRHRVRGIGRSVSDTARLAGGQVAASRFKDAVDDLEGQRDRATRTFHLILESVAVTALAYGQLQARVGVDGRAALASERAARMRRLADRLRRVTPDLGFLSDSDAVRAVERRCALQRHLDTRLRTLIQWLDELEAAAVQARFLIEQESERPMDVTSGELRVLNAATGPVAWFRSPTPSIGSAQPYSAPRARVHSRGGHTSRAAEQSHSVGVDSDVSLGRSAAGTDAADASIVLLERR